MVRLHIKRGDESQFLYDTTVTVKTDDVFDDILAIYNGRLKLQRICSEMEELAKHGTFLPPNMLGLTDEQIEELKLVDEWGENICIPSGGFIMNPDPIGRRNGKQPLEKMGDVILRTVGEVNAAISKKQVDGNICVTQKLVQEQLDLLRGACMIVYPMNLPPHDPIRLEFENKEELGGTHSSLQVMSKDEMELWFCGKQIFPGKPLCEFIGKNDKTKVIVKIQRKGQGPPGREPIMTEEQKKELMLHAYRKQEQAKVSTQCLPLSFAFAFYCFHQMHKLKSRCNNIHKFALAFILSLLLSFIFRTEQKSYVLISQSLILFDITWLLL